MHFSMKRYRNLLFAIWAISVGPGGLGCSGVADAPPELEVPQTGSSRAPLNSQPWVVTAPMAVARAFHGLTVLGNGKVLATGGSSNANSNHVVASTELYSPTTGKWTAAAPMSTARTGHVAVLLTTGKVLVAGGYTGSGYAASAELYDPFTNRWSPTGAMSTPRHHAKAVVLPGGKVLVMGGYNSSFSWPVNAELYDPVRGDWSPAGSMSVARSGHVALLLGTGKVLVAGGETSTSRWSSAELYDPNGDPKWTLTGAMSTPRSMASAVLLSSGKVLVTGGYGSGPALASTELYNPNDGTWTGAAPMGLARYRHTTSLLPGGRVLAVEGRGNASSEIYEPGDPGNWTATSTMRSVRDSHRAVELNDGMILVSGGLLSGIPIASAELFVSSHVGLGSSFGIPVYQGNLSCGGTNVYASACTSASSTPDLSFTWTAPAAGPFIFTTAGSTFDTVLQLLDASNGLGLGCNDNAAGNTLQSSVKVNLAVGQSVIIVVSGFDNSCGKAVLNIQRNLCTWTQWYDRDDESGAGDYEWRFDQVPTVCVAPEAVECKTIAGVDWTQTGQKVSCSAEYGFACVNAEQIGGMCQDYKVRFCCP